MRPTRQTSETKAPMSMRAAKISLRKKMQAVAQIKEELEAILDSLPHPTQEELKRIETDGVTLDLYFMGAVQVVTFFLSEACLMLEENDHYAKSRRRHYLINDHIEHGMKNLARPKFRLPPASEEDGEA